MMGFSAKNRKTYSSSSSSSSSSNQEDDDDHSHSSSSSETSDHGGEDKRSVSSDRFSSSNGTGDHHHADEERDEAHEVRQMAQDETRKVRFWRIVVTSLLLAVAVAVTVTTYIFLMREQRGNFATGFQQFSTTVADAALQQQQAIRDAYASFSNAIAAVSSTNNASWPFYTVPFFESFAKSFFVQSRAEVITMFYRGQ